MRIGSLFSGAGGLDMAVQQVFGGNIAWHCEVDPAASKVLAHHWPSVRNLGDITAVDWADVESVDVLCGGFPCQDVSAAGRRAGITGSRSGLWRYFASAIAELSPVVVIIENVRGLVTTGDIEIVLGDLRDLGYHTHWTVNSASSVAAAHRRRRVFIAAWCVGDAESYRVEGDESAPRGIRLLPTPEAKNSHAGQDFARASRPNSGGDDLVTAVVKAHTTGWEQYRPAIARWESATRAAPDPVEFSSTGGAKLNPGFAEWLMGWPAGWVTEIPSEQEALFGSSAPLLDSRAQLRLCGNGVVPQQAAAAIKLLRAAACEVAA